MSTSWYYIARNFHIFDIFDIVTQNTTHSNIMYLYIDHSASPPLGKGEGVEDESSKTDIEGRAYSQESDFPHTNSFMHIFL